MEARPVNLAQIFEAAVQYVVPLYQRPYVWDREKQWEPLWEDVRSVADRQLDGSPANDSIPHFLGAVVLEQALVSSGKVPARSVIDGQQRLTTLQLLIAAARSVAAEREADRERQAFEQFLFNQSFLVTSDIEKYKVLPTQRDRDAFREAVGDGIVASTGSHRMHEAYRYFRGAIVNWVEAEGEPGDAGARLQALCDVLRYKLVMVAIDLGPGDSAQEIFETLNGRMTPLLAADLIKNHLFQAATVQGARVDELYARYWAPLDAEWWRQEVQQGRLRRPRVEVFINHWLAMTTGKEVVSQQLFASFKRHVVNGGHQAADVLADLARYAAVYERFEHEPHTTPLGRFLYRLGVLEVTTAYPALLCLLGPDGIGEEAERMIALGAIESWLVRRTLTRATTGNYNVVFLGLVNRVRDAARARGTMTGQDVVDYLAALTGESQGWPSASAVRASLRSLPVYRVIPRARLRMILESLEQAMHTGLTEQVLLATDLTIEHVLPQEWQANWPLPSDADPVQGRLDRDAAVQRLGNLTLVTGKLNPTMSNGAWHVKRHYLNEHSVLRISSDIRSANAWDEQAITERGERLIDVALALWTRPNDHEQASARTGTPTAPAHGPLAGPPDPIAPDAFAPVYAEADECGVGVSLRHIVARAREMGLYVRPDAHSVALCPPTDRRATLVTVRPDPDHDGAFSLYKSPTAFARHIPGVTLEAAQRALGASEDRGALAVREVDALIEAIESLIPVPLEAPARPVPSAPGVPGVVPIEVRSIIERHAAGDKLGLASAFADAAAAVSGVALVPQKQSAGNPVYFRVMNLARKHAVAYVWPRPDFVRVEYRLPSAHDTYGVAESRDRPYGIVFTLRSESDLGVAIRLLEDALGGGE